jgi:uncharacterized protein (DUF983 family)
MSWKLNAVIFKGSLMGMPIFIYKIVIVSMAISMITIPVIAILVMKVLKGVKLASQHAYDYYCA